MLKRLRELWKQRKVIGQVINYVKQNQAWIDVILKAIRFAKDGYDRVEIAELVNDVLKIFKVRTNISYVNDKVTIQFYMRPIVDDEL